MTPLATSCLSTLTTPLVCSERCPDCGAGLEFAADVDRDLLARVIVLCDPCATRRWRQMEATAQQARLRERFRNLVGRGLVDDGLQTCTWKSSAPEIEALNPEAWHGARGWRRSGIKNLYLYGGVGLGKTWAARACLREVFVHGASVGDVSARRLCHVASTFRQGDGLFEAWKRVHTLLIDDLDKVGWTQERVDALWDVLDARVGAGRRTIVTSNVDSAAMLAALKAACTHNGARNESHAVAALDRLKPITKLAFLAGTTRRG